MCQTGTADHGARERSQTPCKSLPWQTTSVGSFVTKLNYLVIAENGGSGRPLVDPGCNIPGRCGDFEWDKTWTGRCQKELCLLVAACWLF